MTQEEKARAYDEALNKAKIEINTKGIGEAVNLCYQLFPQLAENEDEDESEDERIRKFLIQHISEWIGCIEHDLKNSSKDIESEKELAMFKAGLAYLERQKENPKSADSIPSDCTAGAKCEDRWHKVVDSLPDNPREVLCKDEAGNYFIGRYYVGEGWEISNYDDEDKPHHLNPPVSKWIDFPSEKQKEQNGEDEFLEDELSAFLQNYDKEYDDDAAVSDVARHFYEIGKKQNEHKPQTDDEKEYVRTIKSIISDFIRDKKPENLAYYQRIYDWLDGRHVPFSCGHENGQQADPVFSKQEYESHPIISTDTTSAKPAECSKATINGQPIPTENHSVDIPLAEWREEDEGELQNAIDALEFLGKKGVYRSESGYDAALQAASWLKNLPERFNLQPKQKWSEEDKKLIDDVINSLCCYQNTLSDYQKEIVGEEIRKLKSLKPQPKQEWGEDDEAILSWCISDIERAKHCASQTKPELCDIEIHWLKSLKPRWKPSDEQMEALKSTIVDVAKFSKRGGRQVELENEPYYSALHSLYCNLEKLM